MSFHVLLHRFFVLIACWQLQICNNEQPVAIPHWVILFDISIESLCCYRKVNTIPVQVFTLHLHAHKLKLINGVSGNGTQLLFKICMVPVDMDMHNFIFGVQPEDEDMVTVE